MEEQPSIPPSDRTWYQQGLTQMDGERYEEAIALFDRAIECEPDNYDAWYMKGNALFNLKRYEEAFANYERALQLQPDSHQIWVWRGKVLTLLKRYQEALLSYEKALEIQREIGDRKGEVDPLLALSSLYRFNGKISKGFLAQRQAIKIAQKLDISPNHPVQSDSHQFWVWRGKVLTLLKRYQEALLSYEKALEIQREIGDRRGEVDTLLALSPLYRFNGKTRKEFSALQQASEIAQELDISPNHSLYHIASLGFNFPVDMDLSSLTRTARMEKPMGFATLGKLLSSLFFIVCLLFVLLSIVVFSPIALTLRFFRRLTKRT